MKKWAISLILIFVCCLTLAGVKTLTAISHPMKFDNEILEQCKKYDLKPELVASVINTESHFKANAKSKKEAIGLMQIKLSTVEFLIANFNLNESVSEEALYDPKTNIKFGCLYLNYLNKKFSDEFTALAAYNAGETIVRSWLREKKYSDDSKTLKEIPFNETKNYIKKIKSNLKFYQKVFK